ncbi:MAG: SAM-dependent methyltransferase [Bacteroidales bacterium]|nr:SAM-dependent methyltransferase [Bacteroidales bacterium]
MAYELKQVVPWGRTLAEYTKMFSLSDKDLDLKILGVGDGPASFNAEMNTNGKKVISIDPLYQFTKDQIQERISQTKDIVLEQTQNNAANFIWKEFTNPTALVTARLAAMNRFLEDYEQGIREQRYINHELPKKTNFADKQFDLALCSHFLLLYSQLGETFHLETITEILRISNELRIFPIIDLNTQKTPLLNSVIAHFEKNFTVKIVTVEYEFQKGGNEMLVISTNK